MKEQTTPMRVGVVMAGGAGERFWPLSSPQRPKQLLHLTHPDKCMLAEAVDRLSAVVERKNIYIITAGNLVSPIKDVLDLPLEQILAEPCKRNTGGALTYFAAWLMARHANMTPEDITMAVTTADHRIGDEACFVQTIHTALDTAEEKNALVTCGVTPTYPETGFGYIETGNDAQVLEGYGNNPPVYKAVAFHEKPEHDRASRFVEGGRHFWNSGMFFWKMSVFLQELEQAQPRMANTLTAMKQALKKNDDVGVARLFGRLDNISIDNALMEKSKNVFVVKGNFSWSDVGAWNAIATPEQCDKNKNYSVGNPIIIDCNDCVVYNASSNKNMTVGAVGLSNVIVVVTDEGVLVLPSHRAQDVRLIVDEIKQRRG